MKAYVIFESEFQGLKVLKKFMYGDGTAMNPDERRDWANWIDQVLLRNVIEIDSEQIVGKKGDVK